MTTIAIIGWGSLIWDLDSLADHVRGEWHMGRGPRLEMEFSRVSPKRKMGLAVCLDFENGTPCATHWIASTRVDIGEALTDLAVREWSPPERIGAICLPTGFRQGQRAVATAVALWCAKAGLDGAVWTDIQPNFHHDGRPAFSTPNAMTYLRSLAGESLDEAVRYIENAPAATDTSLRRALAADAWWQAQARRVAALKPTD